MIKVDFNHGLFGTLRAMAGAEWTGYVNHPFVQQLAVGSLPEPCFRRFLTQDYLFLIHYARAYALLAFKGQTLGDIRAANATLQAIVDELPVHVKYCTAWGLTEERMEIEPEAAETMTYTRYVLDIGHSGDVLDLMAALMPCVAGYGEIGQIMLADKDTVLDGNPYGATTKAMPISKAFNTRSMPSTTAASAAAAKHGSSSSPRSSPRQPGLNRPSGRWA
jgi:thiaminase/transcriptional activator TenA